MIIIVSKMKEEEYIEEAAFAFGDDKNVHAAARLSHGFDRSLTEQVPKDPIGSSVGNNFLKYFLT